MKKTILTSLLTASILVVGVQASFAHAATAGAVKVESQEVLNALELRESDRYEGFVNAPIQVVEYASMSCGHCGDFHNKHYKEIKAKFVDTGKVRFVLRELPWDNRALAVSMVARCAPKDQYFKFISAFFNTQDTWARSDDFMASIKQIARLGGMKPEAVDACMQNASVNNLVRGSRSEATDVLKVNGTPTFFVNGRRIEGMMTAADLGKIVADYEAVHGEIK